MRVYLLLLALVLPLLALAARHPYPADDPFYRPPHGWKKSKPGDILRSRKIEAGTYGAIKLHVDAWQILYRTERTNSTPLATVTTVLVPKDADTGKLVSMASPENACTTKCAPSYLFRYSGHLDLSNLEPRWEQLVYLTFLQRGWIVVSPDHEGPNSAFSAGVQQGKAVLDSIRAVLRFKEINWNKHVQVIGHGYSGGAIANGWAAAMQHIYAPEIHMAGWSLGGTPSDPAMTLNFLDGTLSAGIVVNGAVGLAQGYPEIERVMEKKWTDAGRKAVADARDKCIYEMVFTYANQTFQSSKFINGNTRLTDIPAVGKVMDELVLGRNATLTPKAPVFMFHAAYDEEIVWYQANNTAVAWCGNGANIRFLTESSPDMNHVATYLLNIPYIVEFMEDRFSGKDYYDGGCQFDNMVKNPVWDVKVLGERTQELLVSILALLGQEIGSSDNLLANSISVNRVPGRNMRIPVLDNKPAGNTTNKATKNDEGSFHDPKSGNNGSNGGSSSAGGAKSSSSDSPKSSSKGDAGDRPEGRPDNSPKNGPKGGKDSDNKHSSGPAPSPTIAPTGPPGAPPSNGKGQDGKSREGGKDSKGGKSSTGGKSSSTSSGTGKGAGGNKGSSTPSHAGNGSSKTHSSNSQQ